MDDVIPERWDSYNIINLIKLIQVNSHKSHGRNDKCSICLEPIDYVNENTICCINRCNNSVHQFCWNKYNIYNGYPNRCVICRHSLPVNLLFHCN